MYYSNGNYEAFARPMPPKDADKKSAYLVGIGLASLAAAVFLIRDGGVDGKKIHIFEELAVPGGSMDGIWNPQRGFIIRGGREMEAHFEPCGICSGRFHPWKRPTRRCWMNFIG